MTMHLDSKVVENLLKTARGLVKSGALPSFQLALGLDGEIVLFESYGEAVHGAQNRGVSSDTLYAGFSTTKALMAAATWLLLQEGKLSLDRPVYEIIPEFGSKGKNAVRIEHLLTHTAGFPNAPFHPFDWLSEGKKQARFSSWRLDYEPGSRFIYHSMSSMWVLGEVIERVTGMGFQEFIRSRIFDALGLEEIFLGLPPSENQRVADIQYVGKVPSPSEAKKSSIKLPKGLDNEDIILRYNMPAFRALGTPGGGVISTAKSLALFYQHLLHAYYSKSKLWKSDLVHSFLQIRTGAMIDPMTNGLANRALGFVISGGDDRFLRTFGMNNSPSAFGHAGIGGQIAWADPVSGLSFVFLTNGFERDLLKMGVRTISLSSLASKCAVGDK